MCHIGKTRIKIVHELAKNCWTVVALRSNSHGFFSIPIISRDMTAECDREVAQFAGLHSLPIWNRCLLCGTDLELDWPDLCELNASDIKNHAHDKWRRAAGSGCPFCSIVIAVIDDAQATWMLCPRPL